MILPKKENLSKELHNKLYDYDIKEYFSLNRKLTESLYYTSRINEIIKIVQKFIPFKKIILDVGCSQGTISLILAEKGYKMIGIDTITESLNYANLKYEKGNCNFVTADMNMLPFTNKFDCIIISEVIEHIDQPLDILTLLRSYLKEHGILIITTPNGCSILNINIPRYNRFKLRNKNIKIGPEKKDHVFNFDMSEIKTILEGAGFDIIESRYINSYLLNPITYHIYGKLSLDIIYKINLFFSNIPIFKNYTCSTLLLIGRKGDL